MGLLIRASLCCQEKDVLVVQRLKIFAKTGEWSEHGTSEIFEESNIVRVGKQVVDPGIGSMDTRVIHRIPHSRISFPPYVNQVALANTFCTQPGRPKNLGPHGPSLVQC